MHKIKRRDFMKLSLVASSATMIPNFSHAAPINMNNIRFSNSEYTTNQAQTIIVFLYGGASQLGGNITNLDEIEMHSAGSHKSYFGGIGITPTPNGCWKEAGGDEMEKLIADGDMTLYRSCYSQIRESEDNRAHGVCVYQNQKGSFSPDGGGIVSNIANILYSKGVINENTIMPFVTMEGESTFYEDGATTLPSYLKPIGINETFNNPYARSRWTIRRWTNYTSEEREIPNYNKEDSEGGFNPALTEEMDRVAQNNNQPGKIKDFFGKREVTASFIEDIKNTPTPDLGVDAYVENNNFAKKMEAAVKLLDGNPDTKIITIGTGGLGGWDDHNKAVDYVPRHKRLFSALNSAMAHLKAIGKNRKINIMVFSEFGRNVNLNSGDGWDHGNLQNFFVLGGEDYFTHEGIVGETVVDVTGRVNRLWLKPKNGTYWFEPLSIAATLYKIYGIENPDILTGGNYPPVSIS